MSSVESFYQAAAAVCFLMLGLWWSAMTNRAAGALVPPRRRRLALQIHLSFLLPGLMSLAATLTGSSKLLWRGSFVVLTAVGAVSTLALMRVTPIGRSERLQRWVHAGVVMIYVLMGVLAVRPALARDVGLDTVTPLQVEGLLLCVLILLGAMAAWSFMVVVTDQAAVIDLTEANRPATEPASVTYF